MNLPWNKNPALLLAAQNVGVLTQYREAMIQPDSVLRNLPSGLNPKQALVIDGLRHAAEIANLAYRRLQQTLTQISVSVEDDPNEVHWYTAAFLDVWSFVDAIDRFRSLWTALPTVLGKPAEAELDSFSRQTQDIRNLRNVADHIATRADYVVAHKGTALGILHWITVSQPESNEGFMCVLVPGTATARKVEHRTFSAAQRIELPSGFIRLSAGEYEADISAVLPHLERRVRELEAEIARHVSAPSPKAEADILIKLTFRLQ